MVKQKLNEVHVIALKGQRLSDIQQLNPLPGNTKINKTRTGLGATYSEINSERNSFIIEPNVPVIQGKVEDHNSKPENKDKQILGVYKGIYRDDILAYLTSDAKYKKILSTPEGFRDKILPAIEDNIDFYRNHFYLLIDECEKNVQDSSYRGKINAPFDVFFEFENKGLISATPLGFSDPRFKEHDFTHYIVQPDYDFSQSLELIHTNNVLEAFTDYLKENPADQYCVFVNSTNAIEALIKSLNIKSESAVFCAEESVDKLDGKDLPIARNDFKEKYMKKYNFFTSRYFSAFDMKLDTKPNVVMITDVFFAKHSILDPSTEVIQIAGRLRNGINKLTHISNFNPELKSMNEEDAILYLEGIRAMLQSLIKLAADMPHKGQQDFLEQIRKVELARFFREDGSYDWFMFDNFIQEERVKGYYQHPQILVDAYKGIKNHFTLTLKHAYYLLGDKDRLSRETPENRKDQLKKLAKQLDSVEKSTYWLGDKPRAIRVLRSVSEILVDGYYALGISGLEKTGYLESKIKIATEKRLQGNLFQHSQTISFVYKYLPNDDKTKGRYTEKRITEVLSKIYNKVGIKKKPVASDINKFYVADRTTVNNQKGFVLKKPRFDQSKILLKKSL